MFIKCNNHLTNNECAIDHGHAKNFVYTNIYPHEDYSNLSETLTEKNKIEIQNIKIYPLNIEYDHAIIIVLDENCNYYGFGKYQDYISWKKTFNEIYKINKQEPSVIKELITILLINYKYYNERFFSEYSMLNLKDKDHILEIKDTSSLDEFKAYVSGDKNVFEIFSYFKDPEFLLESYLSSESNKMPHEYFKEKLINNTELLSNIEKSLDNDTVYFYTLPDLAIYRFIDKTTSDSLDFDFTFMLNDIYYFNWKTYFDGEYLFFYDYDDW